VFEGAGSKQILRVSRPGRSLLAVTSASTSELDSLDRLSGLLAGHGVPVPAVIARTDGGLVAEDGGRQLLEAAGEDGADRFFEQAVAILVSLSQVPVADLVAVQGADLRHFDRDNMLFDLRYFSRHVLGGGASAAELLPGRHGGSAEPWSDALCSEIADVTWSWFAGQPRAVMHRDFQSTNLVVDRHGVVRLVDLGTLRVGFTVYDMASLAFDINLPLSERRLERLMETFAVRFPDLDHRLVWGAAWLRLLQATATACRYADTPFFRAAIPTARSKLLRVMGEPEAATFLAALPPGVVDQLTTLLEAGPEAPAR
jgi:aminoglycoside/choline kinase family phosphotransferase